MHPLEKDLAELAAASEELLLMLRRRDPRYIEPLERRALLLSRLFPLRSAGGATPSARAALERIRQLGDLCEQEARALRREAAEALSALDPHLRLADALGRLAAQTGPSLLDVRA